MTEPTQTMHGFEGDDRDPARGAESASLERADLPLHPADLALAAAALAGDPAASAELGLRLGCVPRILAALNRRRGAALSAEDLQDLAQDTLAVLWRKLSEFAGRSSLETWSYRFCAFELANAVRKKRRDATVAAAVELSATAREETPDAALETAEHESLHASLERLSDVEAAVVRLKHFDVLTFDAIGARLAISPNTAKTVYYRAIDRLRAWLRPRFGEESA